MFSRVIQAQCGEEAQLPGQPRWALSAHEAQQLVILEGRRSHMPARGSLPTL